MSYALYDSANDAWQAFRVAAGWGRSDALNRLIYVPPRPLIHPDVRMIVLFSPKSACTNVAIWFFHQLGYAERAKAHSNWPHRYRSVYYQSAMYRELRDRDLSDFRVVRVVRDPFDRAVSSFRHVQRTGLMDELFAKSLGRIDVADEGISFSEYIDLLERINLADCNIHYRAQHHPIEDQLPVTHLINISTQDLYTRLNEVEMDFGLPVTDFDNLNWLSDVSARRARSNGQIDTTDAYSLRLTRQQARRGPWPPYSAFLTTAARQRLAPLYSADIAAYGTHHT